MSFLTVILRNVSRRPFRSGLTVAAIAIAVCAVVAFVGVSVGFERSFLRLYEGAGVSLVVVRTGVRNPLTSTLDESLGEEIRRVEGVRHAIPELKDTISFDDEGVYGAAVFGRVPESAVFDHLDVTAGRTLRRGDGRKVMLGSILAANLGKHVGDGLSIFDEGPFEIVGIVQSKSIFESGSVIMPLESLQELLARHGDVTSYAIVVDDPADEALVERVRRRVEELRSGITVMPTREHVDSMTEMRVARAMAWLTSAVALLIGGVGTFNTMAMSVHERTGEIGILRAIGWRRSRIVRMVLLESTALSVTGGVLGTAGAAVLLAVLTQFPAAAGLIEGRVQPAVVLQGMALALIVGLLGGLVPAWSASRMLPTAAIEER